MKISQPACVSYTRLFAVIMLMLISYLFVLTSNLHIYNNFMGVQSLFLLTKSPLNIDFLF